MIKVKDLTPDIYYKESRDFQLFGRLYELIINYVKTNIDLINNPLSKDLSLLYLNTLGFFPKRPYNDNLLSGLCKSYSNIIKNKGSMTGITLAVNAVLKSAGVERYSGEDLYYIEPYDPDTNSITIYVSDSINSSEICLLEELLDYIAPIGLITNIKSAKSYGHIYDIPISVAGRWQQSGVKNSETSKIASNEVINEYRISGDYTPVASKQGNQALGTIRKPESDVPTNVPNNSES